MAPSMKDALALCLALSLVGVGRVMGDMDCARSCALANRGAVVMYHARKAGGTSLRSYIWRNFGCAARNWTNVTEVCGTWPRRNVVVYEGPVWDSKLEGSGDITFLATLREPIDRALSSYRFEGRWKQKEPNKPSTAVNLSSYLDRYTSAREAAASGRARARARVPCDFSKFRRGRCQIWTNPYDYYCRLFSGSTDPPDARTLDVAKGTLRKIQALLVTDARATFGEEAVDAYLRHATGWTEPNDEVLNRTPLWNSKHSPSKGGDHGDAVACPVADRACLLDAAFGDASGLDRLTRGNECDIKLFAFARSLVRDRIARATNASATEADLRSDASSCDCSAHAKYIHPSKLHQWRDGECHAKPKHRNKGWVLTCRGDKPTPRPPEAPPRPE